MGVVAWYVRNDQLQKTIVIATGAVVTLAAIALCFFVPDGLMADSVLAKAIRWPIIVLDFILTLVILWLGYRRGHAMIMLLAAIQLVGLIILEIFFTPAHKASTPAFVVDGLALAMVLIVSVIGSLIAFYSLGYMTAHEEHLHKPQSVKNKFFAFVLVFLGAMNGLVLADDLSWVFFFWEVTTLCSFFLIGHDETKEAQTNACNALWMNLLGGVGFIFAIVILQRNHGTISILELRALSSFGAKLPMAGMILPMAGLCFAGLTKSAQAPFQSWLTGAMVAPTPVSALLHSSTMVKAGVYLIIRLAPLYKGAVFFSGILTIIGAFTFIAAAALAAGQNNGKKILAYSTISNLGLIIACAGINTPASISAAIMLVIFHAISKSLLFLCMGAIEQKISSRDIEHMRGLFKKAPCLAIVMAFGIVTMMLPPFGMLLAKWMAIESSVGASLAKPLIVLILALGSGITVLFWGRWAGILLGSTSAEGCPCESEKPSWSYMSSTLAILGLFTAVFSLASPALYYFLVEPTVQFFFGFAQSGGTYQVTALGLGNSAGVFLVYPIFVLLGLGAVWAWWAARKNVKNDAAKVGPYMAGVQAEKDGQIGFIGPMKGFVPFKAGNYYLEDWFGEKKLAPTINIIALVLLIMLLGGVPS